MIQLPPDFREFLQLLNSNGIEYLVVGGYAVTYHGSPRATADLDIWVAVNAQNAAKLIDALRAFGFTGKPISPDFFLKPHQIVRIGMPPLRIELLTTISGVGFADCYARRKTDILQGVEVSFISLDDLKTNKKAAGRLKDLTDLQSLERGKQR